AGDTGTTGGWQVALLDRLRDRARGVLYLGRTQRTVTARLRRALEVRDRHCAFPGCHVDVSRTHAHHVRPWEDGGETTLANLVLLCPKHHHAVHEGGWTITPTDGIDPHTTGCWTFTPPRTRP
ncbi:MAG: HNH endonuclease signature motif containing protein, partial [Actinomycetales bacterium]|nr:HNH endonuclease signature motif containing protein [Actinomycetales bacterium]